MTIKHLFPVAKPTLDLNFAAERSLDPLITFSRSSTGTYVDAKGILQTAAENEPRFDHDPETGESLGLLIEESRVNYVQNSIDFNAGDWSFTQIGTAPAAPTCTPNSGTAPDGTNTATRLECALGGGTTGGDGCYLRCNRDSSTKAVASLWMKSNTGADQTVYSTIVELDVTVTKVVTNEWRRFAGTSSDWRVGARGDKSDQNIDILIWGAQVEDGDQATGFNTSYIPTSGSASTRAPDVCTIEGTDFSSWYNPSESTFVATYTCAYGNAQAAVFGAGDGTGNNAISLRPRNTFAKSSGVNQFNVSLYAGATPPNVQDTIGFSFDSFGAYLVNTNASDSDITSVTMPVGINKLVIGKVEDAFIYLNGYIARLAYYPRRLSDEQLQAFTS